MNYDWLKGANTNIGSDDIEIEHAGGIWDACADLGNGYIASIDSQYADILLVYIYNKEEPFMAEDMIFNECIKDIKNKDAAKLYHTLYNEMVDCVHLLYGEGNFIFMTGDCEKYRV